MAFNAMSDVEPPYLRHNNAMRDVEPPYLCHNQMASYFEALCVIIDGPALGFLHTRTNLSPFTKGISVEKANSMSI